MGSPIVSKAGIYSLSGTCRRPGYAETISSMTSLLCRSSSSNIWITRVYGTISEQAVAESSTAPRVNGPVSQNQAADIEQAWIQDMPDTQPLTSCQQPSLQNSTLYPPPADCALLNVSWLLRVCTDSC